MSLISKIDPLLDAGAISTFLIEMYQRTKNKPTPAAAATAAEAIIKDKPAQADAALKGLESSFGYGDEWRPFRDTCLLIARGTITVADGVWIGEYLNSLGETYRSRFRKGYVSETVRVPRLTVLTTMAKIRDREKLSTMLKGWGFFDPTLAEKAAEKGKEILQKRTDKMRANLPALELEVSNLRRREVRNRTQQEKRNSTRSPLVRALMGDIFAR